MSQESKLRNILNSSSILSPPFIFPSPTLQYTNYLLLVAPNSLVPQCHNPPISLLFFFDSHIHRLEHALTHILKHMCTYTSSCTKNAVYHVDNSPSPQDQQNRNTIHAFTREKFRNIFKFSLFDKTMLNKTTLAHKHLTF